MQHDIRARNEMDCNNKAIDRLVYLFISNDRNYTFPFSAMHIL